jgi:uncharacterized membrane protein SpoIIM required for sporulation
MIEGFVARRRARWERLSSLLDRAGSPRSSLTVEELDELARLYRQATGDLAIARRDFPDDRSTLFVNQLVTRAHGILYREAPAPLSQLKRFFWQELPREYRASWLYLALAALLLFTPWMALTIAIIVRPDVASLVLSPALLADIKAGETWFDIDPAKRSAVSSIIMTNNIQVSLLALSGGMVAGLGTVYVLVSNGISLGGVTGTLIAYDLGDRLFGFVSPHGVLELSEIVIAGACGLMMGRAIVWAGLEPRRQALVAASARSVRLLVGTLPFMVSAGLIEGFISPMAFPWPFKVAIGLLTGVVMYSYLILVGRPHPIRTSALTLRAGLAPSSPGTG